MFDENARCVAMVARSHHISTHKVQMIYANDMLFLKEVNVNKYQYTSDFDGKCSIIKTCGDTKNHITVEY